MDTFRIYYADGSAFGSEQGTWDEAPLDGVVMVAVKDGERVEYHAGSDYYARLGDGSEATVASTQEINPILHEQSKWIKYGVWTTHKIYEEVSRRAREEFG